MQVKGQTVCGAPLDREDRLFSYKPDDRFCDTKNISLPACLLHFGDIFSHATKEDSVIYSTQSVSVDLHPQAFPVISPRQELLSRDRKCSGS